MTVGLGNREVTPDALGPYVVDQLNITRHMVQEYGRYGVEEESRIVSAIVPGVMAQTGMETAEIVQGVVKETKPDMILVIDALAARSSKRLKPDHTDLGCRDPSRSGCGESQKRDYERDDGNPGDRDRCSDGSGCRNDCK